MKYLRWLAIAGTLLWICPVVALAQDGEPIQVDDQTLYMADSNPFDEDTRTVVAVLTRDADSFRDGFLAVICEGPELVVAVNGEYVGLRGRARVRWRFGEDGEIQKERWRITAGHTGVRTTDPESLDFVRAATDGQEIAVEVRDYRGVEHTYEFDTTGFAEAASHGMSCLPDALLEEE